MRSQAKEPPEPAREQFTAGRRYGAIGLVLVVLLSVIIAGAVIFFERVETLRRAESDNIPWNLSQVEVEYLRLKESIGQVIHGIETGRDAAAAEGLESVRREFNILYSRITTISESPLYREIRVSSDTAAAFEAVRAYLRDHVALIDSTDTQLLSEIRALERATRDLQQPVRELALSGVMVASDTADRERKAVMSVLYLVASTTALLFLVMIGLIVAIWRAGRKIRRSAREKDMTAARLATVISTSPDPIVVSDRNLDVIEFNKAAEETFGHARHEAMGQPVERLIIPEDLRPRHRAGVKRHHETGETVMIGNPRVRSRALKRDGGTFPAEISLSTGLAPDGQIYVAYIRDITVDIARETEITQARDVARAGEMAKERLLNTMSHEMRTPLHGISGALELLETTGLSQTQQKYARIIGNATKTLLNHVENVLHVAGDTSEQLRIEKKPFNLEELVSEILNEQEILAAKNRNEIRLARFPGSVRMVEGDPVRLRQVLANLLSNAAKFTQDGKITLEVNRIPASDDIEFRVADEGIGIPPDKLDRIFEDFYTSDAFLSRQGVGTGLGLGITRRIVDAMDGTLGVSSEVGQGSIFWFRIPCPAAPDAAAHALQDVHADPERREISGSAPVRDVLVVDDDEINRAVLGDALTANAFRVTMASSGRHGVEEADKTRFDCILMDISMPGMSGVDATRLIREGGGPSKDAPIIAMTAHAQPEDHARFLSAGMNDVLTKPYSMKVLIAKLSGSQAGPSPARNGPGEDAAASGLTDPAHVQDMLSMLGPDKTRRFLEAFVREAEETLDRLAVVSAPDAAGQMAADLHRLKGTASMFGATRMRAILQHMEDAVAAGVPEQGQAEIPRLKALLAETRVEIERALAAGPDG
ncbi:ATP-binding protein [Roseovarius salis]|uniref:ATP-binding protein n=1 Tax=Roseovarius salis TaxID=3376063 RepID=UPI0037C5BF7E